MPEEVERNLLYGGALIAIGIGGLFGFWPGVICAGLLLFSVALLVLLASIGRQG